MKQKYTKKNLKEEKLKGYIDAKYNDMPDGRPGGLSPAEKGEIGAYADSIGYKPSKKKWKELL